MWLFGRERTNVSLQLQTAHLSQRRGEESRHQRVMIDSANDLLGGCTAIVSAESLLKRHHLPQLGSTGVIHDFQGRAHAIRGPRAAGAGLRGCRAAG